jgi:hypothetical protein
VDILIQRKDIPHLRRHHFQQAEVVQQGDDLRIYLHRQGEEPLVFLMTEPAVDGDLSQVRQWLSDSSPP